MIWPTFPPVIISEAITSVYNVIAVCMPVTVVPRSSATVAIDTFMTELSSAIRNWPDARVSRIAPEAVATSAPRAPTSLATLHPLSHGAQHEPPSHLTVGAATAGRTGRKVPAPPPRWSRVRTRATGGAVRSRMGIRRGQGGGTPSTRHLLSMVRRLDNSFGGRCVGSFVALQGVDRAMAIASQALTALIPLLLLVSALAPRSDADVVSDAIIRKFELTGSAAEAVQLVFVHSGESSTGIVSLLLLVISGTSLARRIQRMYLQAWQLQPLPSVRGSVNATLGLGALLVQFALLYLLRSLVRTLPFEWVVGTPLSLLASLVLWTSIPWLLLDRRIHWRRLVPGAVMAAVGVSVYGFATTIYMPRLMENYNERYGLFGVTLALIEWLLCIALILVTTTVVATEFDRAQEPWARRIRARYGLEH